MVSLAERFRPAWLYRLLLAFFVPLIFLCGLEVSLRLAGFGRDARFFISDPTGPDGTFRTNPRFAELVFPASFGLKPVNFRLSQSKAEGAKRVFLIGESAAMGVPEPGFGMGPQLEAILRDAHPDEDIELFNLGVTAINSHVILPIVRQAVRFEPDLLIFYMGNNEVVGPFGPGSAITDKTPPLALIRASLRLKSTRTGQLIERLLRIFSRADVRNRDWRGMEMFAKNTVTFDDPRLAPVYENFADNFREMLTLAQKKGIPVIVSTVAVNFSDCAPFASVPSVNGADADSHFWRGKTFLEEGRMEDAASELRLALELDALRFRADARINEIIREVAAEHANAYLAETAESMFPGGKTLFFEHVHLTFEGNNAVARKLAEVASPLLASGSELARLPDPVEVAEFIGFTELGRFLQWKAMDELVSRPPFTGQSTYATDRAHVESVLQDLAQRLSPERVHQAANRIRSARLANPRSSFLALHEAQIAAQRSDFQRVVERIDEHDRLAPAVAESKVLRALAVAQLGGRVEAVNLLLSVIETEPFYPQSYPMLASLWAAMGEISKGRDFFGAWVEKMPDNRGVRLAYAQLLIAAGRPAEARAQWEAVLDIVPDDERALLPLVQSLVESDRFEAALEKMLAAHAYNPRSFANNDRLVQVYQQRGDKEETLRFMRDLIASGPVSDELKREYEALARESWGRGR